MELPWRIVEEAEYFQLEVTVIPGHDGPLTLERFVGFTDKDAAAVIQLTSRTYSGRRGRRLKIEAHLRRTRPASPIIFYFHFTCANGLKITYWTREPREEYLERTADRGWRLRRKLPMPEHVQAKESEARRYYDARPPERRFPSPMQAAVFVTNRIVE
jgi:hypothetical protein